MAGAVEAAVFRAGPARTGDLFSQAWRARKILTRALLAENPLASA